MHTLLYEVQTMEAVSDLLITGVVALSKMIQKEDFAAGLCRAGDGSQKKH